MPPQLSDMEEEEIHFSNVITTFRNYEQYSLAANNRRRKDIYRLPLADQQLLDATGYKKKLDQVDDAIRANAEFLSLIVANPEIFGHDVQAEGEGIDEEANQSRNDTEVVSGSATSRSHTHSHTHSHSHSSHEHGHVHGPRQKYKPTDFDMDKLRSTLKQFIRDWSEQGREEREACYQPMKEALIKHFSDVPLEKRGSLRVLVPGSGLGRLAHDVASMGFACQGNEFSHYMLLSSFLILNRTDSINKYTIYPYVHSFSNITSRQTILQPISIPDVLPTALPPGSDFSLVAGKSKYIFSKSLAPCFRHHIGLGPILCLAYDHIILSGDFEEIYGAEADPNEPQAGEWNAILTCFFIDTAKNIVNYLRIIHRILAPGGVWINLGPLLWHWENNNTNDTSVELDLEEVKALARNIGFEISNERTIDTTYTANSEGMLSYIYHAAFWTATKI